MSLQEKLAHWRRVITVEPILAIYVLAAYSRNRIQSQFELSYFKLEVKWPHHDTLIQMVQSTVPIILVLFFASYSDKTKRRKLFLLLPLLGEIIALFGYTLCMVFKDQCCQWVNTLLRCVPAMSGGENVLYMAALALVSDVSNPATISFRVGILYVVEYMAVLTGVLVEGHSPQADWVAVSKSGVVLLLALLYALFWIKEEEPSTTHKSCVFRTKHLLETSTFLLGKYVGTQRAYFLILLHLISTYYLANFGGAYGVSISAHRQTFLLCWCLSTLVVIPLFTRNLLPFKETMILIVSCAAQILINILTGAARNIEVLYLALVVSTLVVLIPVISTSMVLKLGLPHDFGKLAAMVTIFRSSGISFAALTHYPLNQTSFKFVYFGATLFAVLLLLVIWMHNDYKKRAQQDLRDTPNGNIGEEYETHQV